jgi:hypothetical protein
MAITQAMCTSFKVELMRGIHNFSASGGDSFKIALYTSAATLGAGSTAYSAANEVSGTGYTSGGNALTRVDPASAGTTALADFADTSWAGASFTARGALIYNASDANRAVCVLDFGSDKTVSDGTFTIQFPAADAANAIIRIG